MIIFESESDNEIPSLSEEYNNYLESYKKSIYTFDDYVPEDIEEFYKAKPKYKYEDNIIIPGKNIINSELGEKIFSTAYKYYKEDNIKNAILLFTKIIHYNYRVADSYYYLGWLYFINKEYQLGIKYIDYAIKESIKIGYDNNTISDFYYQQGNMYTQLKDYDEAILKYKTALEKQSDNFKCYNRLGICYYNTGNPEEALLMWRKGNENGNAESTKNYKWLSNKLNKE